MGELIGAASLLLAAIGVLYSVWYPEIREAVDVHVPLHLDDAGPERERVAQALHHRARPLFWSAAILALLLIPDSIRILFGSVAHWSAAGWEALLDYEATQAALLAILVFLLVFTVHLRGLVESLKDKRKELTPQS